MPVVSLFIQANTDGQPLTTKHKVEMYLCKYCTKKKEQLGGSATLFDVLADMGQKNKAAASKSSVSEWYATLGTRMHKALMAEIGEEKCQAVVAHYANKCPEYFCSRPLKHIHNYKKALGLGKGRHEDRENVDGEGEGEDEGEVKCKKTWRMP